MLRFVAVAVVARYVCGLIDGISVIPGIIYLLHNTYAEGVDKIISP